MMCVWKIISFFSNWFKEVAKQCQVLNNKAKCFHIETEISHEESPSRISQIPEHYFDELPKHISIHLVHLRVC